MLKAAALILFFHMSSSPVFWVSVSVIFLVV